MRVLVLGATGMLGHKLVQIIGAEFETVAAIRSPGSFPQAIRAAGVVAGMEASDPKSLVRILDRVQPDAVLNAAGVVKQVMHGAERSDAIAVNALFPNRLAELCADRGIRLVHYSTDCVFSGGRDSRRGPDGYREVDPADARDLYGLGKLLGEPEAGFHLVLRTSIVGRELRGRVGLVEWFLSQANARTATPVHGFTNALFTGLTTLELARLTLRILAEHRALSGLWHVAGQPISKHDLLALVKQTYGLSVAIVPDDSFHCDRRLDGSRFSQATQWRSPDWPTLISQMRQDAFSYDRSGASIDAALPGG